MGLSSEGPLSSSKRKVTRPHPFLNGLANQARFFPKQGHWDRERLGYLLCGPRHL